MDVVEQRKKTREEIINENLIWFNKGKLPEGSKELEIKRKGQAASVKARKEKTAARELIRQILGAKYIENDAIAETLRKLGIEDTQQAALMLKMLRTSGKNALMAQTVFQLSGDLEQQQTQINIYNSMSDEQLQQERQRLVNVTSDSCIDITPELGETGE